MKIGVIGTFINDQVTLANGEEYTGFGGIYYTVSTLASLLTTEDRIYPVCFLGEDIFDEIIDNLSGYKNIDFSYIRKVPQPNPRVRLIYQDNETRDEFISNLVPLLEPEHLQVEVMMDAWLVNFISGFEMALDTYNQFCHQQRRLISIDYHTLALGMEPDGKRFYRRLKDWREWIAGADILQMNQAEAVSLMGKTDPSEAELINFGKQIINPKTTIFNITLGSKGSLLFFLQNDKINHLQIQPYPIDNVVEVTGSGDAFLSGFLVHYLQNRDPIAATNHANFVAGMQCTIKGTKQFYKLQSILNPTQ
ncbi:MAG: PfkB family carbohydrate kinase [bacterium]|nr:PfkB family carbohydrate kinase [bacterium]